MRLEDAIVFAATAHEGQKDKSGEPYILHPLRVMLQFNDDLHRIVAVSHDIKEDKEGYWKNIKRWYTEEQIQAIDAISRAWGEDWDEYIFRVKTNEIARAVKVQDLFDNLRPVSNPTEKDVKRRSKYLQAIRFLMGD